MNEALKVSFSKIKEELDIHLDSINGNTNEINANFDHILRVEQKVDKLSERLDEIEMFLSSLTGTKKVFSKEDFDGIRLSTREQEVFLTLYTAHTELSYEDIARRLGLTKELVEKYAASIISKGVPLNRICRNDYVFLKLNEEFCSLQAKENILGIHEEISQVLR